ncbi:zinc ribbon domain-containing protein [bacterium]|nr:zinc ribbon domain-containing protein [bacterium]
MPNCSKCANPLPSDALFCVECGQPVAVPSDRVCPKCQSSLVADAKFCVGCGFSIHSDPPSSAAPLSPWLRKASLAVVAVLGVYMLWKGISGLPVATSVPTATSSFIPTATVAPPLATPAPQASLELASPVSQVTPSPTPPADVVLYHLERDLNGDQQPESARVVALDRNPEPNSDSRKVLQILDGNGVLQFASEAFEEPFHTDLDEIAESADQKSGLHVLEGSKYPRIRLIFAPRSGNFVDFQFDGLHYVVAEFGD